MISYIVSWFSATLLEQTQAKFKESVLTRKLQSLAQSKMFSPYFSHLPNPRASKALALGGGENLPLRQLLLLSLPGLVPKVCGRGKAERKGLMLPYSKEKRANVSLLWLGEDEDAVFIDCILITSMWQCPKAGSPVRLLWGILQGFTITYFPDGGRLASAYWTSFISLAAAPPSCCGQPSYWQYGSSPLTFPGIHTTHRNSIILATLNDRHEGYFPVVLASLSLPSFKFSLPYSASGDQQVPWPSKCPTEKRNVSSSFMNPVFRSDSLWASSTSNTYLK